MKRTKLIYALAVAMASCLLMLGDSSAHSGRTDKYGGHHNRKAGGYHYHNAGSAHKAANPHQNHSRCGICATSQESRPKSKKSQEVSDSDLIITLQEGLRCMGYELTLVDGKLGKETKASIRAYISSRDEELRNTKK